MTRTVMLVPCGKTQGIFPVSLGLVKALEDKGVKAALFTPFASACCDAKEDKALCKGCAFKAIASGKKSDVLEQIVANYNKLKNDSGAEIIVVEGVTDAKFDKDEINGEICHALDADILTLINGTCKNAKAAVGSTLNYFGNAGKTRVLGSVVINKKAPKDAAGERKLVLSGCGKCCKQEESCCCKDSAPAVDNVIATLDYDKDNYAPRAKDIACYLEAEVSGAADNRGYKVVFDAASADKPGKVLLTAAVPAATEAGTVILCDGAKGEVANAAVITTDKSVWAVAEALAAMPAVLPEDDCERKQHAAEAGAKIFDDKALSLITDYDKNRIPLMSPASFRNKLTELARAAHKRIALPEGDEPRTIQAAAKVAEQNIAVPVLFGKEDVIRAKAKELGVSLDKGVEFVDPEANRAKYVDRLVELRGKKGVDAAKAMELLQDNVFLATMMIDRGEVDGLVSGAVHTTANTIRPPLQIIKTAPNAKLVSAIFFMLMPEQVYIYGDCALNIKPSADELSEIAIQSADTAKAFGIDPRVAMVTYSTMNSGKGEDVDLMIEATRLVREKRPDIAVDGPLQYDAAVMPDVAAQKAPNSPVAGKATVFIFPTLSTGNTVYKAVQRSANLVSIGPMLQGMKKPVNDLSRGALVDDIIYTIAVTAIQATQC